MPLPAIAAMASSEVALSLDTHVKVDQLGLQFGRSKGLLSVLMSPSLILPLLYVFILLSLQAGYNVALFRSCMILLTCNVISLEL